MVQQNEEFFSFNPDSSLEDMMKGNVQWSKELNSKKPGIFSDYNGIGQNPHTLLLCCSDSRYNENCLNVIPGEVFTMKTIANIVNLEDLTLNATIEFAINCLKIKRIIIMGHTDCGGIKTCLLNQREDLKSTNCGHLYDYLHGINEMVHELDANDHEFQNLKTVKDKSKYLSIENLKIQGRNLLKNQIVKQNLAEKKITLHNLIYNVDSGLLEIIDL